MVKYKCHYMCQILSVDPSNDNNTKENIQNHLWINSKQAAYIFNEFVQIFSRCLINVRRDQGS